MASSLVITPYDSESYDVEIEISESGWADLSRLQLLAANRAGSTPSAPRDVLPQTVVEAIRVHNTRELIRGQGYRLAAPAGVFSPFRQYVPIHLGCWWLEGGNRINVRLRSEPLVDGETTSRQMAYSAAFPFVPDNKREYRVPADLKDRPSGYVASSAYQPMEESPSRGWVDVRFDQDGIVDLDSLQILAEPRDRKSDSTRSVSTVAVESIELPTRQEMILGTVSRDQYLAAPGAIFSSLGRRYHWVRFGFLEVSTNNTLRVRLNDLGSAKADEKSPRSQYSVGFQFYPSKKQRY